MNPKQETPRGFLLSTYDSHCHSFFEQFCSSDYGALSDQVMLFFGIYG